VGDIDLTYIGAEETSGAMMWNVLGNLKRGREIDE